MEQTLLPQSRAILRRTIVVAWVIYTCFILVPYLKDTRLADAYSYRQQCSLDILRQYEVLRPDAGDTKFLPTHNTPACIRADSIENDPTPNVIRNLRAQDPYDSIILGVGIMGFPFALYLSAVLLLTVVR